MQRDFDGAWCVATPVGRWIPGFHGVCVSDSDSACRSGGRTDALLSTSAMLTLSVGASSPLLLALWDQSLIDASRPYRIKGIAMNTHTYPEPYRVTSGRERRGLTP
jgi:hypothetical protein